MLNGNRGYVLHSLHMTHSNTDLTLIFFSSFGTYLFPNIGRIRETEKTAYDKTKASISRLQTMAKVFPNLVISGVVRRNNSVRRLIGAFLIHF